jgi:hypothetical protein
MRLEGDDERRGAAVHADGMLRADVLGEGLLERLGAGALGEVAAIEDFHDGALFSFADERLRDGNELAINGGHAGLLDAGRGARLTGGNCLRLRLSRPAGVRCIKAIGLRWPGAVLPGCWQRGCSCF